MTCPPSMAHWVRSRLTLKIGAGPRCTRSIENVGGKPTLEKVCGIHCSIKSSGVIRSALSAVSFFYFPFRLSFADGKSVVATDMRPME
ncbi:hypothetical protein GDO86_013742 [Hymenochirus boettgeri]|uniref:Uncharacterized protein n=1 Tax=Hymenochirus boettgeri TaxID=247094 RepID=A0A8T2JRG1_9PIPI|nr:hypothetical protein GDO86_013742 [Hymenochirus boettgeri]